MDVSLNNHNQDQFLDQFPLGSFLQSRFWKHFLDLQGKKSWQLNVYDENALVAHCLLYTNKLPLGKSYLYAPKGPIIVPGLSPEQHKEIFELILSQIRDITIATRRREEIFCRLEPNLRPPELSGIPVRLADPVQPMTTLYLDLSVPQDELFAGFKEKTRYNIRLAQKKSLSVHWSADENGLRHFLKLIGATVNRKQFKTHDVRHFRNLLRAGRSSDSVYINWAEYGGRAVAANMYIVQSNAVTYLHGGFNHKYRELMAPYLLQWEAIKFAYSRGALLYDFWGIEADDAASSPWSGFSRFKKGFGGRIITSPGAFDFIYEPFWYNTYCRVRDLRRKIGL